ncbi:YolD-like family protein [Jeotgalibacillus sp. JSM ZJ347]|uniref:YolD-like family protein n=1 Tax=Jeotgalibacillus sp. JSM ZJ347 TaxID=3342117 RepID=UPI0035A864C6
MNKDRGTIKWTSMMLPEHVKMLKDFYEEMEQETKPELDEQMFDMIFLGIQEALEFRQKVDLKIFEHNRRDSVKGIITLINYQQRYLLMTTSDHMKKTIPFDQVIGLEVV